jgi:DNA-binding CsgD family transcriptional regulator
MTEIDTDTATLAMFEQSGFGLALADAGQAVIFSTGKLAGCLPAGTAVCDTFSPFRGLAPKIAALQKKAAGKLTLPSVSVVTDAPPVEKSSLLISWDAESRLYTIYCYPSHDDSEKKLAGSLRLRRISDEIIRTGGTMSPEPPRQAGAAQTTALVDQLSAREREVVGLLASGQPNKGVARILGLSTKTVEAHRARALKRLNVRTTADLIRVAIEAGLIDKRRGA